MQRRRVPNCHQALKAWNRHRLHQVKMRLDPSIPMTVPKRLMSSRWTEVDLVKFHQLSAHRRTKEVTRGTGARTCGSVFRCEYCGMSFGIPIQVPIMIIISTEKGGGTWMTWKMQSMQPSWLANIHLLCILRQFTKRISTLAKAIHCNQTGSIPRVQCSYNMATLG